MADMKQIHDFAVKWCDKFRDQNINYIELVDHFKIGQKMNYVITSYSIHYTKLYDHNQVYQPICPKHYGLPGDRITSYNVCYTKLLRKA